jgi:hypothetical protein
MIVYRVAPQAMEIESRQVISMTECSVFIEGANGSYRKSRTYGGAQYFYTKEEARQFIVAREQEKIKFFTDRRDFHLMRLAQAASM